jgi:hypothetical protein
MVQGQPDQIVCETSSSKQPDQKWNGGVAQAVKCLLGKHEALSSNPTPTLKKKNSE